MHGLAAVAKSLLRVAFRVSAGLGPFGPGIAVAVQRDSLDAEALATTFEHGCPIRLPDCCQVGKQGAAGRKLAQHCFERVADANNGWRLLAPFELLAVEGDYLRLPVDILG